jgi:hypothetical protein
LSFFCAASVIGHLAIDDNKELNCYRCASAANVVCRDFDVFKTKIVSLSHQFIITMALSVY